MATLDEAAIQLAETLPVDAVPAKLRCGSCNKLALDALKLPCCAQSICQPCSLTLPETCPICGHAPVSADDCTPIKSLRMSVKAFIKNEQKKRIKDTEVAVPPADTSTEQVTATQPPADRVDSAEAANPSQEAVNVEAETVDGAPVDDIINGATDAQIPQDNQTVRQTVSEEPEVEQEDEEDEDDHIIITTERPEQEMEEQQQQHAGGESHHQANENQEMQQVYGNGHDNGNDNGNFGFDQSQQGFGGMDFNNMNNFNPMMMQNGMGMPNFPMGMQNMMGMPGMNMDPSMMFNGGFGGMGGMNDMSMMNMGMGMGNMGGFGAMPGMGMGGGPGFFPGNGGYNQSSFGNDMHQNFHHNRGYGGRPYGRGFRGRGWGGYNRGRGNWQNPNQGHFQGNQNYMNQQNYQQHQGFQRGEGHAFSGQQQGGRRGSPSYEPMNGAEAATDNTNKETLQPNPEDAGDSNNADVNVTDQAGHDGLEDTPAEPEGESIQPLNEDEGEGKHVFFERSSAQAQTLEGMEEYAEDSVEGPGNDVSIDEAGGAPPVTSVNAEGGAEDEVYMQGVHEDNAAFQGAAQGQFYDQQHQPGYSHGVRGRGGFRGGRGGFQGRGGAYGYVATLGEPEQAPAPPANAPSGPKAFREGKPNHWRYSHAQPAAAPAMPPTTEVNRDQPPVHNERGRSRSRSRSRSDHGYAQGVERSLDEYNEDEEAQHEKRVRRDDQYERERNGKANGGTSSRKGRSRSETPEEDKSRRRHKDKDEDRHNSRSHRERSRDRYKRRHRSRSPGKDVSDKEDDVDDSRRKSKSDRRRESRYEDSEFPKDKERSRKSSRREDDYTHDSKHRSNNSSKHARSGREERERERDRRPVLEEPQDDIGFKIKGSKSASMQASLDSTAMGPPTTFSRDRDSRRQSAQGSAAGTPNTPAGDPYAEERERRQRERLDRENSLRRQSTPSLGKRTSRDEDEFEAPMGPKSDTGRAGKKVKRKASYKYEDEIDDGYEERDRRWR